MATNKDSEIDPRPPGASRDLVRAPVPSSPAESDGGEAKAAGADRKDDSRQRIEKRGERTEKEDKPGEGVPKTRSPKARENNLRRLRLDRMMSKAELARRAGVSTLTVDRIERGLSCRMDTKRKILEAIGLKPQDRVMVFGEDD
jgi:DNA-binding XRE family transcriptional regulator